MWNSIIRGYSIGDKPRESLILYVKMMRRDLSPNNFTLPFVIKACSSEQRLTVTWMIHAQIIKMGFETQVYLQNALLHSYMVHGSLQCANKIFDSILLKNLVSWNTMIGGYSRMGCCDKAFFLFSKMRNSGLTMDMFTVVNLLSVCAKSGNLKMGRFIHFCVETARIFIDVFVNNALIDMYAKCGDLITARVVFDRMSIKNVVSWTSMITSYAKYGLLNTAREMFEKMPDRNVISWNSMISCYVHHGLSRKALDLFDEMLTSEIKPDETTLVSVITACAQIGDFIKGRNILMYIFNNHIRKSITLNNSIVDMYAKCGSLDEALDLFNQMPERNATSFNVIIGGLAIHGRGLDAISHFEQMLSNSLQPDGITFVGLLCACSHGGLLDIGRSYFYSMKHIYHVPYEIEHYACMVDLLSRGGSLEEAVRFIGNMPMRPDLIVWGSLLGACKIHQNVLIAEQIMKQLLEMEPYSGGLYVLMSNIYCKADRWKDVKNVRKLMKDAGIRKSEAVSSIEINGKVNDFTVEDKRHPMSNKIYSLLNQLTQHLLSTGNLQNISTFSVGIIE